MHRKKTNRVALAAAAAFVAGAAGLAGVTRVAAQQPASAPAAKPAAAPERIQIDKPVKDFAFRDIMADGAAAKKTVKLSDFKGKKAVVAVFMANRCGTTWTYEQAVGDLLKDYKAKGVEVVAIHSNFQETDTEIKGQFEQRNLDMPILDDKETQAFAEYVGARVTPTFLVIDKKGVLRYQGAFDKFHDEKNPYVRPALDAVLAGKPVTTKTSRAFG